MAENVLDLVEKLEAVLHEELPLQARAHLNGHATAELRQTLEKLDNLQREIGMATFEMVRRGEAPVGVIEPRQRQQTYEELREELQPQVPLDPNRFKPPIEAPARCIGCMRVSVGTCGECKKPCCEAHLHASQHPCGEMP